MTKIYIKYSKTVNKNDLIKYIKKAEVSVWINPKIIFTSM